MNIQPDKKHIILVKSIVDNAISWSASEDNGQSIKEYDELLKNKETKEVSLFSTVIKSTDYDTFPEEDPGTGPYLVAITYDLNDRDGDEDEDEDEEVDDDKYVDEHFCVNTLEEARKIYDEKLLDDKLHIAAIVSNVLLSTTYKNSIPVEKSEAAYSRLSAGAQIVSNWDSSPGL